MVYIQGFLKKHVATAAQLCAPLTILLIRSLNEALLPEDWKRANVIPIFKEGEISDPGNYQPISLTSTVYKVLESKKSLSLSI